MQAPARKVKHSVALKNIHSEQFSKLQQKHQVESELLEDLRNFSKQRSVIEKDYAVALGKLSAQYLKKPFPPPSDLPSHDGGDYKTIHTVWKTVLEETDRVSKIRQQAAETYLQKISEPSKPLKAAKSVAAKKVFDQMKTVQGELNQALSEMLKSQKTYNDDEHVAHEARAKSHEAESKVKNRSTGIFTSLAKLQQQSAKLNTRRDACEIKSTGSRNEYILNLAAVNAHSSRYYNTDVLHLIEMLDGEMYEKVCEFFTLFATTELECCGVTQECFTRMLTDSTKISRQYNHQCFLHHNSVFTDLMQYQFEPQDKDTINKITKDQSSSQTLDQEAKKWAICAANEGRIARKNARKLQLAQTQGFSSSVKSSENGHTNDKAPSSPTDPEIKLDEYRQNIRKAETSKVKAESRIEALREGGVDVDTWLSAALAEAEKEEEQEIAREARNSISTSPTKSESPSDRRAESMDVDADSAVVDTNGTHPVNSVSSAPHDSTYINYQEEDDFIEETFVKAVENAPASTPTYPTRCNVLYEFKGSNTDELTVGENEAVDLIGEGDGDGWVRARKLDGTEGFVPRNYLQIPSDGLSVSSADPNEVNVDADPSSSGFDSAPPSAGPDTSAPPSVTSAERVSSYSATDFEVQQATKPPPVADGNWARALYAYEATGDEELSFQEGQLIEVTRKDVNGVDDGFWEGRIDNRVGLFPSLVVEELRTNIAGEMLNSPDRPGPPDFHPPTLGVPPPVLEVTQPTPSDEDVQEKDESAESALPAPPPPPATTDETKNGEIAPENSPEAEKEEPPKQDEVTPADGDTIDASPAPSDDVTTAAETEQVKDAETDAVTEPPKAAEAVANGDDVKQVVTADVHSAINGDVGEDNVAGDEADQTTDLKAAESKKSEETEEMAESAETAITVTSDSTETAALETGVSVA